MMEFCWLAYIGLRIRIRRIHMFLSLLNPDPDPLVRCTYQAKIVRQTLIPTDLLLLFDFLSLKNDVNVPSKSNKQKKFKKIISFLLAYWRSMTKIAGSGSESGSIRQRHGSEDTDPDPYQNVLDPQHWLYSIMVAETRCLTCLTSWWPAAKSGAPPLRLPVRRLAAIWAGIESCPIENQLSNWAVEVKIGRSHRAKLINKTCVFFSVFWIRIGSALCLWLGDGSRKPSKNIWTTFPLILKFENRIRYATKSSGSKRWYLDCSVSKK